ncbi:MAG TPA: alpha-amylase/4-alpha-glucanotransferase domain-containing protein [Candidatus Limnocylindrales bacterium]|nr:alpha-amylase/4-alpha-glucanotransferase domain-containing protein [Candidatus Limnocylindrales bacterium]
MPRRISLALTLHNHQPIGNFGWVFEEVFRQAYAPMVEALGRHSGVHVGLHYSGALLEWLRAEQPGFISDLRALVERGQVEVLGGGLYEPVLASLPERDRIGQLTRMADTVEATFGRRPAGAWLAERVWEPDLPTSLATAGYRWTILDDAHLRSAAIAEEAMWGPFITEDKGQALTVFGTERGLRYRIPFSDVEAVIEYLQEHATEEGDRLGTMGDDGEKFGAWPTTFEHSWGKGRWVERFFEALESNAEWLTTVRPSDWLETSPPVGRVYVPTGSYFEMGEWALPAEESREFAEVVHRAREVDAPELRWLRGAFWRNFQVKYREVNDLHKQMLRASLVVSAMPEGQAREAALDHLYRGQSNDCYWHGLFGGVYIAHMRAATLGHLIAAQDEADRANQRRVDTGSVFESSIRDLDLDGRDELLFKAPGQTVTVDLDEGAGIGAWDLRAARHALTGVLRRRAEAYHETLRRHEAAQAASADRAIQPAATTTDAGTTARDEAASIHELVQVKEPGLADRLVYDDYERRSGLLRFLPVGATAATWQAGGRGDLGDFVDGPFRIDHLETTSARLSRDGSVAVDDVAVPVRASVELQLGGGRLDPTLEQRVTVTNRGTRSIDARIGLEYAITMLGGGGNPDAWWELEGARVRHDSAGAAMAVGLVAQGNGWLGIELRSSVTPVADAWHAPIETVSNSEAGFERVYQGSALLLSWPVHLEPGGQLTAVVRHEARIAVDRARSEPASSPGEGGSPAGDSA